MQISDDLFLGPALGPNPSGDGNPAPMSQGVGPMGRVYIYDVVPAAAAANNVVANQSPAAAGNVPLTAGPGSTLRAGSGGGAEIVLDTPRALTASSTSGGAPLTIYGRDVYGQPMSEVYAAIGTGKKAFKTITRITAGSAAVNLNVGGSSMLGIPLRMASLDYLIAMNYAGVAMTPTAIVLADPAVATTTTGDVRGTVGLQSAPDGIKRLVMAIAVPAIACGPQATRLGAFGVNQA